MRTLDGNEDKDGGCEPLKAYPEYVCSAENLKESARVLPCFRGYPPIPLRKNMYPYMRIFVVHTRSVWDHIEPPDQNHPTQPYAHAHGLHQSKGLNKTLQPNHTHAHGRQTHVRTRFVFGPFACTPATGGRGNRTRPLAEPAHGRQTVDVWTKTVITRSRDAGLRTRHREP